LLLAKQIIFRATILSDSPKKGDFCNWRQFGRFARMGVNFNLFAFAAARSVWQRKRTPGSKIA